MKLNTQLKILSATEARCRELEMINAALRDHIRDERCNRAIYVPFPDKKGLPRLIFNWFKVRPLESMALVHSTWIKMGNKHICANCMSVFEESERADEYTYCPMCAAMMDLEKGE